MEKIKVIYVTQSVQFPVPLFKPECELSKHLAKWLRQETLTIEDVEVLKQIGLEVRTKEKVL